MGCAHHELKDLPTLFSNIYKVVRDRAGRSVVFLTTGLPVTADDNKDLCVGSRPLSLGSSPQHDTMSMWCRRAMTHYNSRPGSKYFNAM